MKRRVETISRMHDFFPFNPRAMNTPPKKSIRSNTQHLNPQTQMHEPKLKKLKKKTHQSQKCGR